VQSGRIALDYAVLDAASTDETAAVVGEFNSPLLRFISAPDSGMYDALARHLAVAPAGSICCYLNAGDFYARSAFDTVADVFEQHPSVEWLTGMHVTYNERSQVISARLPFRYRRRLVRAGCHDGRRLPMVQQESTFWRASLHDGVDWTRFARCRLAGDAYLWQRFARRTELTIVEAYLGGFKLHGGQLSENLAAYRAEMRALSTPSRLTCRLAAAADLPLWHAPPRIKKLFNRRHLIRFDPVTRSWG
jgi:hypothetical protein